MMKGVRAKKDMSLRQEAKPKAKKGEYCESSIDCFTKNCIENFCVAKKATELPKKLKLKQTSFSDFPDFIRKQKTIPKPLPIPAPAPKTAPKPVPKPEPLPAPLPKPVLYHIQPPNVPITDIVVFTDGSAIHNGKKYAKAGYSAVFPDHPHLNISSRLSGSIQTNNRAEYYAVISALEQANIEDPKQIRPLHVYTDSELLLKSATVWMAGWKKNGWKTKTKDPVKNKDLLIILDSLLLKRKVKWTHVKAHTNGTDWKSIWNDKADKLARATLN